MARTMWSALKQSAAQVSTVSLDRHSPPPLPQIRQCWGSRLWFAADVQAAGFRTDGIIFDSASIAASYRGFAKRVPALCWLHGVEVWESAREHHIRTLDRVPFLLANSHYTRERASTLHNGFRRAEVCWLGTEEDINPNSGSGFVEEPNVLIVGRMVKGRPKGHEQLIRCWPRICQVIPDATLIVVGGGSDEARLMSLAQPLIEKGNVAWLGNLDDSRLATVWKSTSVFAMPSFGEGFGLVYAEAMRWGKPVLSSTCDAGQEINSDGVTGFSVPMAEPEPLEDAILALLESSALRKEMGSNAFARWSEHFSFSCFSKRFLTCLDHFA